MRYAILASGKTTRSRRAEGAVQTLEESRAATWLPEKKISSSNFVGVEQKKYK